MSIKLGNGTLNKAYLGATEIKKGYLDSSLVLDNSITILNSLYTENDAAGNDTNSVGNWPSTSKISITSVPSTDTILADNYAIRLETTDVSAGFGRIRLDYLTQGIEYIAVFRARNVQGDGGIFNWEGVTNASYDITLSGTDWVEGVVTFTPNNPVIGIKVYPGFSSNTIGDAIEISSISIMETIAPELYTLANAANPINEVTNIAEGITLNSTITSELINVVDGTSNYSIRFIDGGGSGFKNGQIRVPAANFTAGTNYTVKIRARVNTGHSGDNAFFFAWSGITNTVNTGVPLDTYAEYIIPITSNGEDLVMTCYPPGGASTDYLEISSISIKETN